MKSPKYYQGKGYKRVLKEDDIKNKKKWVKKKKKIEVSCDWANRGIVSIDPHGQAFPCCFWSTTYFEQMFRLGGDLRNFQKLVDNIPQMQEYVDRLDEFNVEKRPIEEIIKDPLFNEKITESWKSYSTLPSPCRDHCSNARPESLRYEGWTKHGNASRQQDAGEYVVFGKKGEIWHGKDE